MPAIIVNYDDKRYSEDVIKLTKSDSKSSSRYNQKYNLTTKYGTYPRTLQLEDLVAVVRSSDIYVVVPVELSYDPYRIANYYYGDKDLYWVILAANRLTSNFELEEGMTIRIPDLASIYGVNGLLVRSD